MRNQKENQQHNAAGSNLVDPQKRRSDLEQAQQERLDQEKQKQNSTQSTSGSKTSKKYTAKGNNQSSADNDEIKYNKRKKNN